VGKIYFPHNLDFRGRVYPIPPHLNHLGADLNRGLLEFAEGKRLGKQGLKWLKIHLANKMGKDKLPMDDRALYTDSIMDMVTRCAEKPTVHQEWLEAEDQWQTLAAMIDLNKAMKLENPEDYISHLHVHQDGSCNGLQHYAALGRDFEGAEQVNLVDRQKPGDLYTHICDMVSERVAKEAADHTHESHEIAKKLKGNVKRKIVKQTVMTTVYGVTFIGARK
jgi:DNA-directed RNA polymerase